jgi:Carboxypeptidase regulatory-like domain
MRSSLAFLFPLLALTGLAQTTYTISGKVISNNKPVKNALVSITSVASNSLAFSCFTGDDGRFAFTNLPAEKFSLMAEMRNRRPQFYRETEGYSSAIVTGPGLNSQNIVFELAPVGSISGSVTDEEGDPIRNAQVMLFHQGVFSGKAKIVLERNAQTDSSGRFHFGQLRAGTYVTAISARPWYAQNSFAEGQPSAAEFDVAYPITYSGGSTDPKSAAPINVTENGSTQVDIVLRPVPALHIRLRDLATEGDGPVMLFAIGPDGAMVPSNAVTVGSDQGSTITGLAPGRYEIRNHGSSRRIVELTADTSLEAPDHGAASISGRVTFEGAPPEAAGRAMITLASGTSTARTNVSADGSFTVSGLEPGRYRIELANMPSSYVRTVLISGKPAEGDTIELAAGAAVQVSVIAGAAGSKLDGIALQNGQPVAGAMVLLLPNDLARTDLIRRDQSDSDGTFTLPNIAPGSYTLVAIDDGSDLAYADAAVIQPYLAAGRSISIPAPGNGPVKIDLSARRR